VSPDLATAIRRVQAAYGDACFACGVGNPLGLRLEFTAFDDGWVSATFTPRPDYRGAPGSLHGGIAATALDEILVWAGIATEGVVTVTGTLDLKYRRPLGVDEPVVARGRVEDRSGRRLAMHGQLLTENRVAVEGRGIYLVSAAVDELPDPGI
jgi:acyl-coenzyme A thioesterase PaaI-like protein